MGETLFTSVGVRDPDAGLNGVLRLFCDETKSPDACDVFDIQAQERGPGSYIGLVTLKKPLDFEARSSYDMVVVAEDQSPDKPLSSTANILIEVTDVQDQPPAFLNAPFTATVPENVESGTPIFDVLVMDGDTGNPREVELSIVGDNLNYFSLSGQKYNPTSGVLSAILEKSQGTVLDREEEQILRDGGLYAFQIRAKEIQGQEQDSVTVANVTIVVTDVDDQLPVFNRRNFTVPVSEEVGVDTPLPNLNIIVNDGDVAQNAQFNLELENVKNSEGVFTVYPKTAVGRTPVIIRVANPDALDYETEEGRTFLFKINAVQGQGPDKQVLSSADIRVMVTDANDNVPTFEQDAYEFMVREDAQLGDPVGTIVAVDRDSGRFGQVEYELRGFGAERFQVNSKTGEISVNRCGRELICIDYENRKSYSLIYSGKDGGGQVATTSVTINVVDVNDNFPRFERKEYVRTVEEGAEVFEPPLIVKATDADGPSQGGGVVYYSIKSVNTDATVFEIDPVTGELSMVQPAWPNLVEGGQFSILVRATDAGQPPRHADVQVTVNVGSANNAKPVFLQDTYEAIVREDAQAGLPVVKVEARDPDGSDFALKYSLHSGAKDNFVIDPISGIVSVAPDSVLDIVENGDTYEITVRAEDQGQPFHQVGEAIILISIQDINDKQPKFEQDAYTYYVLESTPVDSVVATVVADDADRVAELEYDLIEPIRARDKTGNALNNRATYDFASAFSVDPISGDIRVKEPLAYNSAAVIVLTVRATDKNYYDQANVTVEEDESQTATAEVTVYVQAYQADSPQFASPWTPSDPRLLFKVKEQQQVGTVLFKLTAHDPITGLAVQQYDKLDTSDPENLISVSPLTGDVFNNQELDFETRSEIVFQVRARAGLPGQERTSDAEITIQLEDINDNFPEFDQLDYSTEISESRLPNTKVIQVHATDRDTGTFGTVRYAIDGEGSDVFEVDPVDGVIKVKANSVGRSNLDREKQSNYQLKVVASDMPAGGPDQRSTAAIVRIQVQDINDSPPVFSTSRYSAVVPENSPPNTLVTRVEATDPDLGVSGQVVYALAEANIGNALLFSINEESGEIFTQAVLTGKGRKAPYVLIVRALDKGVPELFTDTEVYITVGDVSSNDGVPSFIRPLPNEIAYVPENAKPGTKVFQVEAQDPDDPQTANGKIVYSLPEDGTIIRRLFQLDPESGVLSTKVKLDREERSNYTLILDVSDLGSPPQQTSTLLTVVVTDEDDHEPVFNRQRVSNELAVVHFICYDLIVSFFFHYKKNSVPMEIEVMEELPIGSVIGKIQAVDKDLGENALVEYAIIGKHCPVLCCYHFA